MINCLHKKRSTFTYLSFTILLFFGFNTTKAINDSLLLSIKTTTNNESKLELLIKISDSYVNERLYDKATSYAFAALAIAKEIKDEKNKIFILSKLGMIYGRRGKYDLSLHYYTEAKLESKKNKYLNYEMNCMRNIALVHMMRYNYDAALNELYACLKIAMQNKAKVNDIYDAIAAIYCKNSNYKMSAEYSKKAISESKIINNKLDLCTAYSNFAECLFDQNELNSSLIYLDSSLSIAKEINSLYVQSGIYSLKSQIFLKQNNYAFALPMALKHVDLAKRIDNLDELSNGLSETGQCYLNLKNYYKAISYFQRAHEIASKNNLKQRKTTVSNYLAQTYEKLKNYEMAYFYKAEYSKLNDSINEARNKSNLNDVIHKYETEKKDKEITALKYANLKKENEKTVALALKDKEIYERNIYILLLAILSIVIFSIYFYINNLSQKKRNLLFTKQLINTQENERQRIAQDLHDSVGQNLILLKLNTEPENITNIEAIIADIRNIIKDIHPIKIKTTAFHDLLIDLMEELTNKTSIYFTYDIDDEITVTNDTVKINLYRIVQECVNNILKHSNASNARLTFSKKPKDKLNILIIDDGKGFDKESLSKTSVGFISIKERAKLINASLTIESNKNGTKINIII